MSKHIHIHVVRDAAGERLITTMENDKALVKVYYNAELSEYRNELWVTEGGKRVKRPNADHFTNDKPDALSTAKHMIAHAV